MMNLSVEWVKRVWTEQDSFAHWPKQKVVFSRLQLLHLWYSGRTLGPGRCTELAQLLGGPKGRSERDSCLEKVGRINPGEGTWILTGASWKMMVPC